MGMGESYVHMSRFNAGVSPAGLSSSLIAPGMALLPHGCQFLLLSLSLGCLPVMHWPGRHAAVVAGGIAEAEGYEAKIERQTEK